MMTYAPVLIHGKRENAGPLTYAPARKASSGTGSTTACP
jgi:hypothetical protein